MKKQHAVYLLLFFIVILGIFLRTAYWKGSFGTDFQYHYTVVEQSVNKGELDPVNRMAYCGEGASIQHPKGYYLFPYLFGRVFGVDLGLYLLPVVFGIINILLAYILLSTMYNKRTGLLAAFLLAISLANITKTHPNVYRGDVIIYPFLLAGLIFAFKFLTQDKNKARSAVLAGILSALPVFLWNGYILAIVIFFAAVSMVIITRFFKGENLKKDVTYSFLSFGAQFVTLMAAFMLTNIHEKGRWFLLKYYPIILLCICVFYWSLVLSQKAKSFYPLAVLFIAGAIGLFFFKSHLATLLDGFGSLSSQVNFASELKQTSTQTMLALYGALYFVFVAAVLWAFMKIDSNTAFLLGFLIPAIYTVANANRFAYLASIPIIAISAAFLSNKKVVKKKFDIFIFLTIIIVIAQSILIFYTLPVYSIPFPQEVASAMQFIRENTPKDACIAAVNKIAPIEYMAKRNNYFHLMTIDDREDYLYKFLLYGERLNTTRDFYILLTDTDLFNIQDMADVAGIPAPDVAYRLVMANPFLLYSPQFFTAFEIDNMTIYQIFNKEYRPVRYSYFVGKELYHDSKGKGCFYSNYLHGVDLYLGDNLCDTIIYRMITGQNIKGLERVYFNNGYVIYKVVNYTSPSSKKESPALFSELPPDRA